MFGLRVCVCVFFFLFFRGGGGSGSWGRLCSGFWSWFSSWFRLGLRVQGLKCRVESRGLSVFVDSVDDDDDDDA